MLPSVKWYNEYDPNNGYAGIIGQSIVRVKTDCDVKFRIHYIGKISITIIKAADMKTKIGGIAIKRKTYKVYAKGCCLPAVTGFKNDANNGYAGILRYKISGLMIDHCIYKWWWWIIY